MAVDYIPYVLMKPVDLYTVHLYQIEQNSRLCLPTYIRHSKPFLRDQFQISLLITFPSTP